MSLDDRWGKILDGVAEYIENAPAEEILEDARLEGLDPKQCAEEVRKTLQEAVVLHGKAKRAEATRAFNEESQTADQPVHLPRSPEGRRHLLQVALERGSITLQNRDFAELTDEDVEVQLRSLAELGHLDDLDLPDEDE